MVAEALSGGDYPAGRSGPERAGALAGEPGREPARAFSSVYFGGGTPTYLDTDQLITLLETIRETLPLEEDAEITVEANPDPATLTPEKLQALASCGVNRLSLGAQSWQNHHLRALGRDHTAEQTEEAAAKARAAGFANLNLDLMYALPGQTLGEWQRTLERALALSPEHISAYSLIYEEGTPFHRWLQGGRIRPVDEEEERAMYDLAYALLPQAGLEPYEISNFARPGYESRHNLLYWQYENWWGVGVGAHSHFANRRWRNWTTLDRYEAAVAQGILPVAESIELSLEDEMVEMILMGLRLAQGLDGGAFHERFGVTLDEVYGPIIDRLVDGGFLARTAGGGLRLTGEGRPVGNAIFAEFLDPVPVFRRNGSATRPVLRGGFR